MTVSRQNSENDISIIRRQIDNIDSDIADLLLSRLREVIKIGKLKAFSCDFNDGDGEIKKTTLSDPEREQIVIERVESRAGSILEKNFLRGIYRNIITESKKAQIDTYPNLKLFGE